MNNPKEILRHQIRQMRRELEPKEKEKMDRQITKQLLSFPLVRQASSVYLYASLDKEVGTWGLMEELWKKKIPLALPRVEGKELCFCFVDNPDQLIPGAMGIYEPSESCSLAEDFHSLVIAPGLAFSPKGARMGYGGGYYDRFFLREPLHLRIALAYPFQVCQDIPLEPWDQSLHGIVTPEAFLLCDQKTEIGKTGR